MRVVRGKIGRLTALAASIAALLTGIAGAVETSIPAETAMVFSADRVSIRYQVSGDGDPALVFVHGWCCDQAYWKKQVPYFARNHKVVTIDLGGHGESGLGREDWTMEAFGADVVAVLDRMDLENVVLIGHSMGGTVIVEAARQAPDRIVGLIGVDTLQDVGRKASPEVCDAIMAPMREDFQKGVDAFLRQYMFTPQTDEKLLNGIVRDMSSAPPEVGLSAMENLFGYDMAAALKEVRLPIHCVNADKFPVNVEGNRQLAASYEVELLDGVGHFLMLEDAERFNPLLESAIEKLLETAGADAGTGSE